MKRNVILLLVLFGLAALSCDKRKNYYQYYPNIPGETLFENDRIVVQRFVIQPGQWEGIHAHPGNQLYVHIKGGEWTVRYGEKEEVSIAEHGSVGWMDAVDLNEEHESGNTGNTPIELLWIAVKPQ